MSLYDILVQLAADGYDKIKIDLVAKSLSVGKQVIIDNGVGKQYKIKVGDDEYEWNKLIEEAKDIDELYAQYKYSTPSERDNTRHYFKALPASELSDAQLVYGMNRLEARIRLEAYILLAWITGLIWIDPSKFFYQGKDKDFIILKKYL